METKLKIKTGATLHTLRNEYHDMIGNSLAGYSFDLARMLIELGDTYEENEPKELHIFYAHMNGFDDMIKGIATVGGASVVMMLLSEYTIFLYGMIDSYPTRVKEYNLTHTHLYEFLKEVRKYERSYISLN